MSKNFSSFSSLNSGVQPLGKLGDGKTVKANGRDIIEVKTKKGIRFVQNILLILELDKNWLSVAQILKMAIQSL